MTTDPNPAPIEGSEPGTLSPSAVATELAALSKAIEAMNEKRRRPIINLPAADNTVIRDIVVLVTALAPGILALLGVHA